MYFKCTRFSTISRIKNVFTKVFFNSSNSVKIKKKKKKEAFSLINVKENLLFSLYEFFFFRILL